MLSHEATSHKDNVKNAPENMRRWVNVGLPLGQRRRRLANSKPTLDQRLKFAVGPTS